MQGGVMAACPGGDPPADRGELPGLGEVPQRVPVAGELGVERRSRCSGLDEGRAGNAVDLENSVHEAQVDRHRARVAAADVGLDSSRHAGPAAERDGGRACRLAPAQQGGDVVLPARPGHHVRQVIETAAERPDQVAVRLAVCVRGPVVRGLRADARHLGGRTEPRSGQVHPVQRDWFLQRAEITEAKYGCHRRGRGAQLRTGRGLVLIPPRPVASPPSLLLDASTSITGAAPCGRNAAPARG